MWNRTDYVNQYVNFYVVTWHVLVCAVYDDDVIQLENQIVVNKCVAA